jgi:hypothetical protein
MFADIIERAAKIKAERARAVSSKVKAKPAPSKKKSPAAATTGPRRKPRR